MQPENVQNVQNVLDVLDILDVLNVLNVSAVTYTKPCFILISSNRFRILLNNVPFYLKYDIQKLKSKYSQKGRALQGVDPKLSGGKEAFSQARLIFYRVVMGQLQAAYVS